MFLDLICLVVVVRSFPVLHKLNGQITDHSDGQDDEDDNEFGEDAELGLQDVGHDESQTLPQPIIGEGSLLVLLEEDTVQG